MRRLRILAPLAVAAACAAPGTAGAAAPWTAPAQLAGPADLPASAPAVDLGPFGRGLAGWSTSEGPADQLTRPTGRIALLAGAAAAGGPRDLSPYDLAAPPQAYGAGHGILLLRRRIGTAQRVAVAIARADGSLGPRRVLADRIRLADTALSANEAGDAAAVWVQSRGTTTTGVARNDRLWLAVRRAGGALGRPRVLVGSGRLAAASVTVGRRGDVLVAFTRQAIRRGHETRERRVQARIRRAGRAFGPIDDLGPQQGFATLATAIAAGGRAYVAWGTQDLGEQADEPFRVHAAALPAGRAAFRDAQLLDPGSGAERPVGRVAIGVAEDGTATVAWSGVVVRRPAGQELQISYPVRSATTDAAGRFGAAGPVAGGNGAVGGLTIDRAGAATVVWTGYRPGSFFATTGVLAARRPRGADAFAVETVTDRPRDPNESPPAAALDARSGRVVVLWGGRDGLFLSSRAG